MPKYLVHSSPYRARLRAPSLADPAVSAQAVEIITKSDGVTAVETGRQSILVHLNGQADMAAICEHLDSAIPALSDAKDSKKVNPEVRKYWLRSLLTCGVTTVCLAAGGWYHAHAWVGGAFALLATHHVWERRKRI